MLNKNATIDVTCPKCETKIKKTIRELEGNPIIKCPKGHDIQIKSEELLKGLKGFEDAVKKIQNKYKR